MKNRKLKSYKTTSVNWGKSQADITKLLNSNGIQDVRFSFIRSMNTIICEFNYPYEENGKIIPIGTRILWPCQSEDERVVNQMHRALFYYLKSKFEAMICKAIEFKKEFFSHLIVYDGKGNSKTMYEIISPQYDKGLLSGEQGDIKLLN